MIIPTLEGGGAEKNFRNISNYYTDIGHSVEILTLLKYREVNNVRSVVTKLNKGSIIKAFFSSLFFLLKNRKKFDVYILTLTQVNILFGMLIRLVSKKGGKLIIRESNIPSIELSQMNKGFLYKLVYRYLYKKSYSKSDCIIVQSDDMKNDILLNFNIDRNIIVKINNPVEHFDSSHQEVSNKIKTHFKIICIGRLHKQKRYDRVLDIAEKLNKMGGKYEIDIYGEGSLRNELEKNIQNRKLGDIISLKGFFSDVSSKISDYDVLLITSEYEGFPNVVLESLVRGVPVLSFNFPGGANELVLNEFNGYVVSNVEQAIKGLMLILEGKVASRNDLISDTLERFNRERILDMYNKVLY